MEDQKLPVLRAARALIARGWCRGTEAQYLSPSGGFFDCSPRDPKACSWCATGALVASTPPGQATLALVESLARLVVEAAAGVEAGIAIAYLQPNITSVMILQDINDREAYCPDKTTMLALFDKAIADLESCLSERT